jgi:hypothetical protein
MLNSGATRHHLLGITRNNWLRIILRYPPSLPSSMLTNQDDVIRGNVADEEVQDAATGLLELGIEVRFFFFFFFFFFTLRKKRSEGGRRRNFTKPASGPRMKSSNY